MTMSPTLPHPLTRRRRRRALIAPLYNCILLCLSVVILAPPPAEALWKKNKKGDVTKTKNKLVVDKKALENEKRFKKAARPKIRGRFGLPSRRKKKLGLSAVLFPGVSPEEFAKGEEIPVWVDLVESRKTQVPYEYYDLPTCPGPSIARASRLRKNLGAKLQGHNLKPSPYGVIAKVDVPCTALCSVTLVKEQLFWLRRLIDRQYRIHMSLDSLPVVVRSRERNEVVLRGFPVGFKMNPTVSGKKETEYFLYNHVRFVIRYREDPDNFSGLRIVGFEAEPVSIAHRMREGSGPISDIADAEIDTCSGEASDPPENDLDTVLNIDYDKHEELEVIYSYEIQWKSSNVDWSDRWDVYMAGSTVGDSFHFFSLVNSLVILFFLTGTVAIIVVRTLRKDISRYNELESITDEDESGWKLVHGDVFRPPSNYPSLLCVAVGTGAQLATAVISTLLLSLFGFLSPMKKGQTLTTIIVLYVLSGSVSGYCSSRLYKYFEAKSWKKNMMLTAAAFPGLLVGMFLVLDLFLSFAGAATAVSIWTILALFLLRVCVSTPLVFAGSYLGFRSKKLEVPTKTNQIARVVPEHQGRWYIHPPYSMLIGGLVPFGSICVELYFIMGAVWLHQIYYVMGFLLAVVLILAATCAEMAVIMCYIQLCAEDHQWWWRSFLNAAGAGFWLFVYSVWFLSTNLKLVGVLPTLVYLTYMCMMSIAFSLFCGSIGFFSTFWFTKRIYGALKVD